MSTIERTELLIGQRQQEQLPISALELPGIDDVLKEYGNLGPHKILMGVSRETGDPVTLDFRQMRSTGSMIILADTSSRKASFLQNIGYQALRKDQSEFQVDVLTSSRRKWGAEWMQSPSMKIIHHNDSNSVDWLLSDFIDEYQMRVRIIEPNPRLLLLDNLANLVELLLKNNSQNLLTKLGLLCEYGPSVGIFPVATMNGSHYKEFTKRKYAEWKDKFPSKIFGPIKDPAVAMQVGCTNPEAVQGLIRGAEFYYQRPHGGLNFWLPLIPR